MTPNLIESRRFQKVGVPLRSYSREFLYDLLQKLGCVGHVGYLQNQVIYLNIVSRQWD